MLETKITYDEDEPLEVVVLLYMTKGKRIAIHDVDNRPRISLMHSRGGSVHGGQEND